MQMLAMAGELMKKLRIAAATGAAAQARRDGAHLLNPAPTMDGMLEEGGVLLIC